MKKNNIFLIVSISIFVIICGLILFLFLRNKTKTENYQNVIINNNSYEQTTFVEDEIDKRIFETNCEKALLELTQKNTYDYLEDKIVFTKNNFSSLGQDTMKKIGFNPNHYDDFAIMLSIKENCYDTIIIVKSQADKETQFKMFEEYLYELQDFCFITDTENKYKIFEEMKNYIVVEKDGLYYFVLVTDERIIQKIK